MPLGLAFFLQCFPSQAMLFATFFQCRGRTRRQHKRHLLCSWDPEVLNALSVAKVSASSSLGFREYPRAVYSFWACSACCDCRQVFQGPLPRAAMTSKAQIPQRALLERLSFSSFVCTAVIAPPDCKLLCGHVSTFAEQVWLGPSWLPAPQGARVSGFLQKLKSSQSRGA